MFVFIVREVVSADPKMVGTLGLAATLAGLPGSILGGSSADRWGHKRMFVASSLAFAYALMADATPLALSSTVFQMYMSFAWIGNIPASILIGFLLGFNLTFTALTMSALTGAVLLLGVLIRPYEAGKATKI